MIDFLVTVFSGIPHLDFHFKWIKHDFDVDWRGPYAQSLALIAAAVCAISLLLLLTITIAWICQCCAKEDATVKSRRKVRRLSTILFALSVCCFFMLGVCLFGNDYVNRGVTSSVTGLHDVNHAFSQAIATSNSLNDTCRNATRHIKQLEDIVHAKSKEPGVNQTLVEEVDGLLTRLSDTVEGVSDRLGVLQKTLADVSFLQQAEALAARIELERWMLLVILLSIMMCVLFAGVIGFCRQSKKGAVVFSGLGIVIFVVGWLLLGVILPATTALADFCSSGGAFINARVNKELRGSFHFYRTCTPQLNRDTLPPTFGIHNLSDALTDAQQTKIRLDSELDKTFNQSAPISNASSLISLDGARSLREVGSLEATLACSQLHDDILAMHYGICHQSILGASLSVFSLLLLSVFLFALLIIVSKSWNLFTRFHPPRAPRGCFSLDQVAPQQHTAALKRVSFLPSDYVEVDEDDPFFPRHTDSNIPVDIYGTHVFNPRTRDRAEASTGTTIATGDEQTAPLWPNRTSAPPMTNSLARSPYEDNTRYGNYQDRFDV